MRIAIAQEIHDGIAQDLSALGYQIDLVLAQPDTPSSVRHEMRIFGLRFKALPITSRP